MSETLEKLSPNDTCRNSSCFRPVRQVGTKKNYYCDDHIRCGNHVDKEGPCEGCKNTFQGEKMDYKTNDM